MSILISGKALTKMPASSAAITTLSVGLGIQLPNTIVGFWQESDGASFPESGVVLYGTADIVERNRTYEVIEYAHQLLLIGDDGGGNGFFIRVDEKDSEVLKIDIGAIGASDGDKVANKFSSWLTAGCPTVFYTDAIGDKQPLSVLINIVLEKPPKDGLKGMLLIKQKLLLSYNSSELNMYLKNTPVVIMANVYRSKYARVCDELNKSQDCLVLESVI